MASDILDFVNLDLYKACREFRREISQLVSTYPKGEEFRLKDQLIRASRSVTANIAEGNGRWYYKENIQFCRKSRGSLKEVLEHLIVSFDEGYIDEKQLLEYKVKQERCIQLLNGYIRYLKKAKPVKDEES